MDPDRYCSPPEIRDLVFGLWAGGADLDPCYDPTGLVFAHGLFDIRKGQDGLKLPWHGRVYLNPPYSGPAPWLRKAAAHYILGDQVLALVNVQSAARYWRLYVFGVARAICFLSPRVNFLLDGRVVPGNRYDQAAVYYGPEPAQFARIFGKRGSIVRPSRADQTGFLTPEIARFILQACKVNRLPTSRTCPPRSSRRSAAKS
jgi:hypothetical protein